MEERPNIDERLIALDQRIERLHADLQAMHEDTLRWRAEQKRLDERERRGRKAILAGFDAYFQILNEDEAGKG